MAIQDLPLQLFALGRRALATGAYATVVPALLHMQAKPARNVYARGGTAIDEIVLHGTESKQAMDASLNYLASKNDAGTSIHYFIGREFGQIFASVPEDKAAGHAGNPDRIKGVTDHNYRSIGIELYQQDVSFFKGNRAQLDFTAWQYDAVAQLCYDICLRRRILTRRIVSHGEINHVQRADPQGFDWPAFRARMDRVAAQAAFLGDGYALP